MKNLKIQARKSLINKHYKGTKKNQIEIVFKCFFNRPQTMKEASINTKIDRANICYYIAKFRKANKVAVIKSVICPITKHKANLITTNPNLFPTTTQLKLF